VFEHWRDVMGKGKRALLDNKRKWRIQWAIKHYGIDEAKRAVDGCKASPFHQGDNPTRRKHNDLTLIFRSAEHVERFLAFAADPPPPDGPQAKGGGQFHGVGAKNAGWETDETGAPRL
jgi:hypothetical protein